MTSIKKIIELQKENISPDKDLVDEINNKLKNFISKLDKVIKKSRIKVVIFIGGSFAKETVIKKDNYEIDLFLRFDKKYRDKLSEITENLIRKTIKDYKKIHGSRDYFQINFDKNIIIELIPVVKISRPKEAENITDLSYFHVNYVKKHLKKNKKLADEIKLVKTFCHAQNCYGAESYIKGFSGYALELLIIHYKSFEKFLREVIKIRDKIIIFNKGVFKNKNEVMMNINKSKLESPIILIDPTFPERNALAALSNETFSKFKNAAALFLKNPSLKFFEKKEIDFEKAKENFEKKFDFIIVEISTDRQEGDIAGSKLMKFYNFLLKEIEKYFNVKKSEFEYNSGQKAKFYISALKKDKILIKGPPITNQKYSKEFRKRHSIDKIYIKKGILYAERINKQNLREFLKYWRGKNENKIEEMYIKEMRIL